MSGETERGAVGAAPRSPAAAWVSAGLAVLLISMFTGVRPLRAHRRRRGAAAGADRRSEIENCETGADANASDDCRLAAASLAIDQFWAENVEGYREPELIIVDGQTATQCGTASNATGPFYCPPEENVYVDPTFFALLRERFDATAGPARPAVRARARVRPPRAADHRHHGAVPEQRHRARTATACAPSCRPTASPARGSAR